MVEIVGLCMYSCSHDLTTALCDVLCRNTAEFVAIRNNFLGKSHQINILRTCLNMSYIVFFLGKMSIWWTPGSEIICIIIQIVFFNFERIREN